MGRRGGNGLHFLLGLSIIAIAFLAISAALSLISRPNTTSCPVSLVNDVK